MSARSKNLSSTEIALAVRYPRPVVWSFYARVEGHEGSCTEPAVSTHDSIGIGSHRVVDVSITLFPLSGNDM